MTGPEVERRNTPSVEIKAVEAKVGLWSRVLAGAFFLLAGAAVFAWGIKVDDRRLMIGGAMAAVGGAWTLPSVFDHFKPILLYVFPNGLPFVGGRRSGDPQPPNPNG